MNVYFHAKWNPLCKQIEEDYHKHCAKFGSFVNIKVDVEKLEKIKFYYHTKYEPSFILFLNGVDMKRIIGYNFKVIEESQNYLIYAHRQMFEYYGDTGKLFQHYHENIHRQQRENETNRDWL